MNIVEQLSRMDSCDAISLLKGSYADFCAAIHPTLERTSRKADIVCAEGHVGGRIHIRHEDFSCSRQAGDFGA